MARAVLVQGSQFRLYREADGQPGTFVYVGLATTLSFTTELRLEDLPVVDCDDPDAPQPAAHFVRGSAWEIAFSGRVDVAAFRSVEGDQQSASPHAYRVSIGVVGAGRSYTGQVFFEQIQRQSQERGFVAFSASCRGTGGLTIIDL